jgi:serine/threonine protein kinase
MVTTSKGKGYPLRVQSSEERETWLQKIKLAQDADAVPNYSISAPADGNKKPAAAFLNEIGGPKPGPSAGKRASIKPMHLNSSVSVTDFDLLKVVGKGAFGKVFLVKKREGPDSEKLFAMKVLDKEVITQKGQVAHTKSERDILHEIQHPFIVSMHYAFQTERKLYMITDYYPGGNLFAHVQRARRTGGFEEV